MSPEELAKHKRNAAIFAGIATVITMLVTGGKSVNVVALALGLLSFFAIAFLVAFVLGSKNWKRGAMIGMGFSILLIIGNMVFPIWYACRACPTEAPRVIHTPALFYLLFWMILLNSEGKK